MISPQTLPHSLEAERAVIGACIVSPESIAAVIDKLNPSDFFDANHKVAFEVLANMFALSKPIDYITFTDELNNRNVLDRIGGHSFIISLVNDVTTTDNVAYYAEIIRDNAIRRRLIEAGAHISNIATGTDKTLNEIIDDAEKVILDASQNRSASEVRSIREIMGSVITDVDTKIQNGEMIGYPTGFNDLDAYTNGLQPSTLNILAARPSMGKTALALNIAQFGGDGKNLPVLVFSLEMPAEQLINRMIAAESGTSLNIFIKRGLCNSSDFKELRDACESLLERNIYINDATSLSAMEFRARCRQFKLLHPDLALVVVDYLQLMSGTNYRDSSRNQEISEISRTLKATAREIECPVLALSQLSRESERRTDRTPQLSDLRDSGAIEQDADLVMMLYREDYYSKNENTDLRDSKADVRIAKNRNGTTGTFSLIFKRDITRFFSYGNRSGDDRTANTKEVTPS